MFDHCTVQTLKTFRHFRQNAYSGSFRADGQLLVAGGDEPIVQLFDVTPMKLELKRKFKGHTAYVICRLTSGSCKSCTCLAYLLQYVVSCM